MMSDKISILQTGRIGDLWYTAPLAQWFSKQGHEVEVVYDRVYGNPFTFFPYVQPRPVELPRYFKKNERWGHFFNEAVWQLHWLRKLKAEGRRVIWNEIFPFRWVMAHWKQVPYVEFWYKNYPEVNFRKTESTHTIKHEKTILVFQESQSVCFSKDAAYYKWIFDNLEVLQEVTGYKPVVVAYGDQPDHPVYETWRGSMNDYQQMIASCGIVFGISTSAHVLGQMLGKPTVVLYAAKQSVVDSIGQETIKLRQGNLLDPEDVRITLDPGNP